MSRIERIHAREVFDSRGNPTVEVDVVCGDGSLGRAIVPSGASTGTFEAVELRDNDAERLGGKGVKKAVASVNGEIGAALHGADVTDQLTVDRQLRELDGSANLSRLGANAVLGVSLATSYAAAAARRVPAAVQFRDIWRQFPSERGDDVCRDRTAGLGERMLLPLPMVNMISGGLHAGGQVEFQDFLALPVGASSFREAFEWIVTIYRRLGQLLTEAGYEGQLVGDEGGYGPRLPRNETAVEFVIRAIEACDLRPGEDVAIGLDVASSHFFDGGHYTLKEQPETPLDAAGMTELLADWVDRFPIISIEDGLVEEDWEGWKGLTDRLGSRVQLIGDDLFVTNAERLQRGISSGVGNSVLIKLNQIGTVSSTLQTMRLALDHGYWPVVSARSGETEDVTIADLVVGTGAGQLKVGSVARSERLAKYNQLLRLEEEFDGELDYLGGKIFRELSKG